MNQNQNTNNHWSNKHKTCSKCSKSLPWLDCNPDFFRYFVSGKDFLFCDECLPSNLFEQRTEREHFWCNCGEKYGKWGSCHDLRNSIYQTNPLYWDNKPKGIFKSECYACSGKLGKNGEEVYDCEYCERKFCSCCCRSRTPKCSNQQNSSQEIPKPNPPAEPKPNPATNSNQATENYNSVRQKAQTWWSSLSSAEREKELSRLVENMKLGKYLLNNVEEGEGSGWADNETWWIIQRGKFASHYPHLVPIQIVEEFEKKEFGTCRSTELMKIGNKDNPKPNPAADNMQNNNISPNPGQSSQNSPQILIKREDNSNQTHQNNDNKTLIISLKEIKKVSLVGGNLVIEFNQSERSDQTITAEQITNNRELSGVKNYLRSTQSSSISQQELDQIINSNSGSNNLNPASKKTEPLFWIGLGLSGSLVLVGLSLLMVKIKKKSLKKK